jgi:hypothetical protein
MRKKKLWSNLFLLILVVGLLAAAVSRFAPIINLRNQLNLEVKDPFRESAENSELRLPLVAFFTFRSLAIDYLWIRADELKNQGQYFDALHLARWICSLQPNLASVWDFQAWNMAYNISAGLPTCPERWNWVRDAFKLLRDEGLSANPKSPLLFRSLGWIFQHKIGGLSDDCQRFYKLRLAFDLMPVLGPGNGSDAELTALADAPGDWEQLIAQSDIAALVAAIKKAEPKFATDEKMLQGWLRLRINPDEFSPPLQQVITDNMKSQALRKLDLFIRARELKQTWKLDPRRMIEINQMYGPIDYEQEKQHLSLDWRLPYPHAIYWAMNGLEFVHDKGFSETNLHRMVYQSLQDLYHYGHLEIFSFQPPPEASPGESGQEVHNPTPPPPQLQLFVSQDLRMFPIAYHATLDLIKSYGADPEGFSGSIASASINLARAGIVSLYLAGHRIIARRYFNDLQQRYPDKKDFQVEFEEFVRGEMSEMVQDIAPKDASDYIDSLLRDAFARYALRDDENAYLCEKWAEQILAVFKSQYPSDEMDRLALLDFPQMRWLALQNFMGDPSVDPNIKDFLLQRLQTDDPALFERVIAELEKQRKARSESAPQKSVP